MKLLVNLENSNLILSERDGGKRLISINPACLEDDLDPFSEIPQSEYRPLIAKLVDELAKSSHAKKVILFGAIARGEADRMSDIDLCIISENSEKMQTLASMISYQCSAGEFFEHRWQVNIFVISSSELEEGRGFITDLRVEGITLYG